MFEDIKRIPSSKGVSLIGFLFGGAKGKK